MIVPLVLEDEWLAALKDLPVWAPPPMRVVVLAPHPDDETLGAGGFIAAQCLRGTHVVVVAATDGERAYGYDPNLGKIREAEQRCAGALIRRTDEGCLHTKLLVGDVESDERFW